MRFGVVGGRGVLVEGDAMFDVGASSHNRLPHDPHALLEGYWDQLLTLAPGDRTGSAQSLADVELEAPVPRPPLVLAVVANHPPAERKPLPMIVAKSPSAVTGPFSDIVLPDAATLPLQRAFVIAEPELAVVTRAAGRRLTREHAAAAIAGYTVAQDITERQHEFGASSSPWTWDDLPAKTLGKSFDTFLPLGPIVVTPDEVDALTTRCWINGELLYEHCLSDLLWSPVDLVMLVSTFMSLMPGSLILCGAGAPRDGSAPRFLADGDVVRTEIDGIGVIENRCRQEVL